MARVQLALDVTDLDAAVDFYSRLLGTPPHKRRPGYANFAVADPPLKLVLFEGERGGTLNHLGIEVGEPAEVDDAVRRLSDEGLETDEERGVTCCHATQDKVWLADPDGARWEVYTITDDAPDAVPADTQSTDACEGACACA
jgi:catechol 2,3-dioxygenase-like lactoylglutathione lyase family enzyme